MSNDIILTHFLNLLYLSPAACDSDDPDALARCLPLAAFYAGDPNLLKTATDCAQLMQKLDLAVGAALVGSRIVEKFVITDDTSLPVEKILEGVVQELEDPNRVFQHPADSGLVGHMKGAFGMDKEVDTRQAVAQIGLACRECSVYTCVGLSLN